jgi:hypothetical protein
LDAAPVAGATSSVARARARVVGTLRSRGFVIDSIRFVSAFSRVPRAIERWARCTRARVVVERAPDAMDARADRRRALTSRLRR